MISFDLFVVLLVCVVIMFFLMSMQAKWYKIGKNKTIFIAIILVLTGVLGSEIWFFVENGEWGGRSLYGAIVFSPIVFFPIAKFLKIPYTYTLDFVAPSGCLALGVIKLQCLRDNCCVGKEMYQNENFVFVRFPSQIVEMVAFLLISAVLFYMSSRFKYRKKIFPWFLLMYGLARFVLDFFRETIPSYWFGLSAGSFWSMISGIVGATWLLIGHIRTSKGKERDGDVPSQ